MYNENTTRSPTNKYNIAMTLPYQNYWISLNLSIKLIWHILHHIYYLFIPIILYKYLSRNWKKICSYWAQLTNFVTLIKAHQSYKCCARISLDPNPGSRVAKTLCSSDLGIQVLGTEASQICQSCKSWASLLFCLVCCDFIGKKHGSEHKLKDQAKGICLFRGTVKSRTMGMDIWGSKDYPLKSIKGKNGSKTLSILSVLWKQNWGRKKRYVVYFSLSSNSLTLLLCHNSDTSWK